MLTTSALVATAASIAMKLATSDNLPWFVWALLPALGLLWLGELRLAPGDVLTDGTAVGPRRLTP